MGTFDDEDVSSDVTFADDNAVLGIVSCMHCIDDLLDLRVVEVLHEVIAKDSLGQQLPRPAYTRKLTKTSLTGSLISY